MLNLLLKATELTERKVMFLTRKVKSLKVFVIGGLTLFFCLSSLPCYAMGSRPSRATTVNGNITNSSTKAPIIAAAKIYNMLGKLLVSANSDAKGNYSISSNSVSGFCIIICSATNYSNITTTRSFSSGGTYTINFSLKPNIQQGRPVITSITPSNLTKFETGDTINISVTVANPANLTYRFSLDNTILKDWSTSSTYSFKSETKHRGRHKIKVEVKDNRGTIISQTSDIFIFIAFPKPTG